MTLDAHGASSAELQALDPVRMNPVDEWARASAFLRDRTEVGKRPGHVLQRHDVTVEDELS
jgi:hypothetical protein